MRMDTFFFPQISNYYMKRIIDTRHRIHYHPFLVLFCRKINNHTSFLKKLLLMDLPGLAQAMNGQDNSFLHCLAHEKWHQRHPKWWNFSNSPKKCVSFCWHVPFDIFVNDFLYPFMIISSGITCICFISLHEHLLSPKLCSFTFFVAACSGET